MDKKMIYILVAIGILMIIMTGKKESNNGTATSNQCVITYSIDKDELNLLCLTPCVPVTSSIRSCLQSAQPTVDWSTDNFLFVGDSNKVCSSSDQTDIMNCLYGGTSFVNSCTSDDSTNSITVKDTSCNHYNTCVTDNCLNGGQLEEYSCKDNELYMVYVSCPNGCSNGVCNSACTDECTSGATQCSGSNKQTCGNYDADSCLEWGNNEACPNGCSGGVCTGSCPIVGDTAPACDGIKISELGTVAQSWINAGGPTGTLLNNLASAAQDWINHGGPV